MGNYMSARQPNMSWDVLKHEIVKLGEDMEVEIEDGECGRFNFERCQKYPGHTTMTPVYEFTLHSLPPEWRMPRVFEFIAKLSSLAVKVNVKYVSKARPNKYFLSKYRGRHLPFTGTGSIHFHKNLMKQPAIDCPVPNCPKPHPHKVTPMLSVATSAHVVYDNEEAKEATVEVFYDYEGAPVVKGQVLRVESSGQNHDSSDLLCVSHDLELFNKFMLLWIGQTIWSVYRHCRSPTPHHPRQGQKSILVFIVSHPHGHFKHISVGEIVKHGESKYPSKDKLESIKLRSILQFAERTTSSWRTKGWLGHGMHFSPEILRDLEQLASDNPEATWADYIHKRGFTLPSGLLDSIQYTAATCPGSSGAAVHVIEKENDVSWALTAKASHFRAAGKDRKGRRVNASGVVLGCK